MTHLLLAPCQFSVPQLLKISRLCSRHFVWLIVSAYQNVVDGITLEAGMSGVSTLFYSHINCAQMAKWITLVCGIEAVLRQE